MEKKIRTEIVINASKEKLWQVLTDFEGYASWNPFIVKVEGKPVAGTQLRNTMMNGDKAMVFKPFVIRVDENRYFDWLGSLFVKGIFDGHHTFEIIELSDKQVLLKHGETFSGLLSGMIFKKIGADTRHNFVMMNEALKKRVEALSSQQ